jgi:O-antigen/teichoic acid export membrane protein
VTGTRPERSHPGLGREAARGGLTTLTGQGIRVVVQMASVVVLARLLSPDDYGIMAMVAVVVGVAEVFRDFGLSAAAIQARELSRQQRNNLFWVNTAIGLTLTLIMIAAAPLIAAAFHQPDLVELTRVFGWLFFINGIATQYRADLNRNLKFSRLVFADILSPVIALAVAVVLAVGGAGYWALAVQQLLAALIMLVTVMIFAGWLPRRPRRGVPMRDFFRFGGRLVGSQLIGYAANNIDSLVIGLRFTPADLGHYSRAFQLLMVPLNQVRAPATQVALPVLSRVQDDTARFQTFLVRGQLALGYTVLPVLGFIVGAAVPVTAVFLGPQWGEVAPLLALIAIAGGFQMLSFVGYWAYLAKGLTGDLLTYSWISAGIKMVCILIASHWGVVGVAVGYAVAPALSWPVSLWWLARHAPINVAPLYFGAGRVIAMTSILAFAVWTSTQIVPGASWVQLVGGMATAAAAFAVTALVVPALRRDVLGLISIGRLAISRG